MVAMVSSLGDQVSVRLGPKNQEIVPAPRNRRSCSFEPRLPKPVLVGTSPRLMRPRRLLQPKHPLMLPTGEQLFGAL